MEFTFKNRDDYLSQREKIVNKAQDLINSGKIDEANAEMENVTKIDDAFNSFAKAKANLKAMQNNNSIANSSFMTREGNKLNNVMDNIENIHNSTEYRTAFMNSILTGEKMPSKFMNSNQNTKTSDVNVVIPTTIMQKIIEKVEEHGHILSLITQTSYKGGVAVPISSAKPTATWVSEGSGSDTQKKALGTITFAYYKLRCAVSVSLEVETVTLDFFESYFVKQVTEALVKALESAVIKGTGSAQPKGILSETVITGQNVDISKANSITYKTLWEMKKLVPSGYRNSVKWCMNYATFCDIMALVDTAGQPIARMNYGLAGDAEATLLGTPVVFSEDVDAYTAAPTSDTVVAFLFNFSDYILNTNLQMTVKQYENQETDDKVTKAYMLADGKVVDKNSLVTLTKKSA